jgi:hypothetical protein
LKQWIRMIIRQIKDVFMTENYSTQRKSIKESDVDKLEQAIEVHGYRGQSKGKHNGVVNIKPDDKELWKSLNKYHEIEKTKIDEYVKENDLTHIFDVKIVAHCPNGDRGIGILYKNNINELYLVLLGFANYNYQLF